MIDPYSKFGTIIATKFPRAAKDILRPKGLLGERIKPTLQPHLPKSTITIPIPPLGPLFPGMTLKFGAGGSRAVNINPFGLVGFAKELTPDPGPGEAETVLTPFSKTTRYGEGVTPEQKELHRETIEPHIEPIIPSVIPKIELPDLFGGLEDTGKWILIAGGVLVGAWIFTSIIGRKK